MNKYKDLKPASAGKLVEIASSEFISNVFSSARRFENLVLERREKTKNEREAIPKEPASSQTFASFGYKRRLKTINPNLNHLLIHKS